MEPTVQNSGLPAPNPAVQAPAAAEPAPQPTELSNRPVNAQSAASDAVQAGIAQEAAAAEVAEATPAPAEPLSVDGKPSERSDAQVFKTGNESFDQVAALLNSKGVDNYADVLVEAASGELSLASKASLVDKLGADVAGLVMKQLDTEISAQRAVGDSEAQRLQSYADEKLGVEGGWTALQEFVSSEESGYSAEDRAALNELLAAGGIKGEWAINEVSSKYAKSQGFTQVPNLLSGDGPTQAGFQPLSKTEYVAEMRDAQRKFGEGSREVEALRNRRSVSIQRGM